MEDLKKIEVDADMAEFIEKISPARRQLLKGVISREEFITHLENELGIILPLEPRDFEGENAVQVLPDLPGATQPTPSFEAIKARLSPAMAEAEEAFDAQTGETLPVLRAVCTLCHRDILMLDTIPGESIVCPRCVRA